MRLISDEGVFTTPVEPGDLRELGIVGLELRETDGDHYVRGVVAPYGTEYDAVEYVETFAPGVFARSLDQRGSNVPLTELHERNRFLIGRATAWQETADGLMGTFQLAPTDRGREALNLARSGMVNGFSVGFKPLRNETTVVDGRKHVVRTEALLDHVGLVDAPAYETARVLEARGESIDDLPFDPDSVLAAPRLARWRALTGLRA